MLSPARVCEAVTPQLVSYTFGSSVILSSCIMIRIVSNNMSPPDAPTHASWTRLYGMVTAWGIPRSFGTRSSNQCSSIWPIVMGSRGFQSIGRPGELEYSRHTPPTISTRSDVVRSFAVRRAFLVARDPSIVREFRSKVSSSTLSTCRNISWSAVVSWLCRVRRSDALSCVPFWMLYTRTRFMRRSKGRACTAPKDELRTRIIRPHPSRFTA